jgi:hypothetical protein
VRFGNGRFGPDGHVIGHVCFGPWTITSRSRYFRRACVGSALAAATGRVCACRNDIPALYRTFVALACGLLLRFWTLYSPNWIFNRTLCSGTPSLAAFPTAHGPSRFIESNRSYFRPSTYQAQKAGWIRMGECDPKVPHKCQELNFWTKLPKFHAASLNCPQKCLIRAKSGDWHSR